MNARYAGPFTRFRLMQKHVPGYLHMAGFEVTPEASRPSRRTSLSLPKPEARLSQLAVTPCHSNLSQLVTVAADSIWWGRWGQFQPR
jgi:hypothetical protein